MSQLFIVLRHSIHVILQACAGMAIATLPRRVWRHWSLKLPVREMALPSSMLILALALAIGLTGFIAHATHAADAHAETILLIGEKFSDSNNQAGLGILVPMTFSPLELFIFLLITPTGWLTMYLAGSGLIRTAGAIAREPMGDLLLTALFFLALRGRDRAVDKHERTVREREEGDDSPDRLVTGEWAGMPEIDIALIASRRKEGWEEGTYIISDDLCYRIEKPFDRRFPFGLRRVYPLLEVDNSGEIMRRMIHHRLPPLTQTAEKQREEQ